MNIALIADDGKKELLVQFCIAYCGVLSEHSICAENTAGKLVSEATGLRIDRYLNADPGAEQIAARIMYNEIDLAIYFCDPSAQNFESINKISRLCDQYMVPFASNVATAEVLIQGLRRGDFSWRDIVNPKLR